MKWKKTSDQLGLFGAIAKMGDNGKENNDLTAAFTSGAQLDALLPILNAIAYVAALETGNSVDKASVDMTRLHAKMFKKAQTKAELLARLSGKKVGTVYQIGSAFDAFNPANTMETMMGGSNPYGEMMKSLLGGMFGEKRADRKVTITEQLTVTYLLQ